MPLRTLRIASRESRLALAQSEWVAAELRRRHADLEVSIVPMTTRGDQVLDQPLHTIGGKGLFIKELEVAMQAGRADLAVHSLKDVPMTLPAGFSLAVVGAREDARDAFVSNRFASLADLPAGARVGTSSLRRMSQLMRARPDLVVESLRGNVNTRLRKLDENHYDAILLAAAGLKRLGLGERIRACLPLGEFLPAIAQAALGVEYPSDRPDVAARLAVLVSPATNATIAAERAFGRALSASCDVPLGAHARIAEDAPDTLTLDGFIASPDGQQWVRECVQGHLADAEALGRALAESLLARGGAAILRTLERDRAHA
jgi:hydroxymethylbilane synthase